MTTTQRVLVCPPTYFAVDYEINPWMHRNDPIDQPAAMRQFKKLIALYRRLGCTIETIAPVRKLPDMVFTANGALVDGKTALIANFRYAQRRAETKLFTRWFRARGFRTVCMPSRAILEGQGEAFFVNGRIFAGCGFRANRASHRVLARVFERPVVSLRLVDPHWYHLDTCFCPLRDGIVLYYPGAFDGASRARIERMTAKTITVNRKEALDFVCNSVPIGNKLITGAHPSRKTIEKLKKIGYSVLHTPLTEFKKSGGGARCLTLNI